MGRKGPKGSAEEDHGGVDHCRQQGTDRPQTPLGSERPRVYGRQDQSGETPGEKYLLRIINATNFQ